jgi:polyhydroxybutyrate depolymerase
MKKFALLLAAAILVAASLGISTQVTSAEASPSIQTNAEGVGECRLLYESGSHLLTIQSGGMDRTVVIYVPTGYTGKNRIPMVLNLHGSQSDAEMQVAISDMDLAAEKYNFIAVSIQGILPAPPGYRWNVPGTTLPPGMPPDDEQFLSDTIDYVQSILCVDAKRVYGTGYSGGGRMISQYACDHPDRIAAIAPVVGLRAGYPISGQNYPDPATCTPSRPVPVVTFAGTDDMVNPYAGGGAPYWQYGAEAALKRWAEINSCNQELRTKQVTEHVKLLY